jgi:hypothetical protein
VTFRISVTSVGCFPIEKLRENAAYASERGVPKLSQRAPHGRPLAVVGGGASALASIDELRNWPGDIWGINGTASWLCRQGIPATLFSVDPDPCLADLTDGVESAILSSICAPAAIDALAGKVQVFDPEHVDPQTPFIGGTTSATRVPTPAIHQGYRSISYFGCEGSFGATTHTFKDEAPERQVLIQAGAERYRTTLQFMNQTESLAEVIAAYPGLLIDRSGGLLGAMIAHPDSWEVVGLSEVLLRELDPDAPLNRLEF